MADVAISYKSDRRSAARHLADVFEASGFSVWWDDRIEPGDPFKERIFDALRNASAVVVLWCSLSARSPWVGREALIAEFTRKLIPTLIEDIDTNLLPNGQDDRSAVPLYLWDGRYGSEWLDKLLAKVEVLSGKGRVPNHTQLDRLFDVWASNGYRRLSDFPVIRHESVPQRPQPAKSTFPGGQINFNGNVRTVVVGKKVTIDQRHKRDPE